VVDQVTLAADQRSVSQGAGQTDADRVFIVSIDTEESDKHSDRRRTVLRLVSNLSQSLAPIEPNQINMTQMGDTDRTSGLCRFIL
jgi:hypothetical protein